MKRDASQVESSHGEGSSKRHRSHSQSQSQSNGRPTHSQSPSRSRGRSRTKSRSPRVASGKTGELDASRQVDKAPGWFARLSAALPFRRASTVALARTTPSLLTAPPSPAPSWLPVAEASSPSPGFAEEDIYEPITDGRGETKEDAISIDSDDDEDEDHAASQRDTPHRVEETLPVAGPSRVHARRVPSRPDLSDTYVSRQYLWDRYQTSPFDADADDSGAPPPRRRASSSLRKPRKVQVSRAAPLTIRQRVNGIMSQAERMRGKDYRNGLKAMFRTGGARATEQEFKQQASAKGVDDQAGFRRFLDRKIPQPPPLPLPGSTARPAFDPKARRKHEYQHQPPRDIEDILERFTLEDAKNEAAISARLEAAKPKRPTPPEALSAAQKELVAKAFSDPRFKRTAGQSQVEAKSIARLRPGTWLDDEIINHYGALVQLRSDKARADGAAKGKAALPNVHVFNSFFYKKLVDDGYSRMLSRWTKKFDIFAKDLVLFPINLGNVHWTAGGFDLRSKRVYYFDSMGATPGKARELLGLVRNYLEKEYKDKKGGVYDTSDWEVCIDRNAPQQDNGNDCGVFSCQTLEALARDVQLAPESVGGGAGAKAANGAHAKAGGGAEGEWEFGPANMDFMRQMMVWEISEGRLMERW